MTSGRPLEKNTAIYCDLPFEVSKVQLRRLARVISQFYGPSHFLIEAGAHSRMACPHAPHHTTATRARDLSGQSTSLNGAFNGERMVKGVVALITQRGASICSISIDDWKRAGPAGMGPCLLSGMFQVYRVRCLPSSDPRRPQTLCASKMPLEPMVGAV